MRGRFRRYSQRLQSRYGREHSLRKTSTAEPNRQPGNPIRSEAELLAASRCNKIAEPGLTQVSPGFYYAIELGEELPNPSDRRRIALLLPRGTKFLGQSRLPVQHRESEMRTSCWETGRMGQSGIPRLTRCLRVCYLWLAGLVIFFIASPYPLWAQSTSHSSISRLIGQDRLDEAEKRLWRVLSQEPDQVWALDLMGEIRVRQKRTPEAEALFRRALALSPNDVHAYRCLGELYSLLGNSPQAIDSYSHVVAIAPADVVANVDLAVLYQQAGQYKESLAATQRVPIASRPPRILPVLAADYFATGEPTRVPPLIPSLLRHANSESEVLRDFVTVLLRNGYLDDAAGIMETVKSAKPSADQLQTLALVRAAQGKLQQAMALLSQALKLKPKSFDLLFESAGLAPQANHWDEMIEFLRRADEVQPNRPEVLQKLSLGLLKTGHPAGADAAARRLNSIQPDNRDNEYVLAFTLIVGDLAEQAEPIARRVAAARPDDANSQLLLGIAEFKTGDTAGAKRDLERCLTIDPHSADAHYYSALIARREGNIDAARADLEEAVRTHPEHVSAEAELGTLDLQTGNLEQARTVLEQAVKLAPAVSQYHYHLGLAYSRLGMQEPARTEMATYNRLRQAEDEERKRKGASQAPTTTPQP